MESSEIQANGKTKYVDGSRIEIQSEVRNGLQSTSTKPEVNLVAHPGIRHGGGVGQDPLVVDKLPTC